MFTGLVREIGVLRRVTNRRDLTILDVLAPRTAPNFGRGDSLAVNGICLTVTGVRGPLVTVEAAVETLRVTTLGNWHRGRRVHLEPALRAGQALDGHLVQGHVDGVGRVATNRRRGPSLLLTVVCGDRLADWLMPKGSVAVDGVSLTVDEGPHRDRFTVNVVPHTLDWTLLAGLRAGQEVNLEMDVLVKAARTGRTAEALAPLSSAAPTRPGDAATPAAVRSLSSILDRGFGRRGTS